MNEIVINTPCGGMKGLEENGVRFFRGIPYARCERFAEPETTRKWDGVLDASKEGPDCPQYGTYRDEAKESGNFYYKEFRSADFTPSYDEHSLTLDIVTPEDAEGLPMLVFIHGGGHETGTVGELPYGSTAQYAARGVVFASVGYRLNVFSLYRSANYGLYDQLAALGWLKSNAAAFGGDPGRITVIGQSAGAMSITDLCYSRLSRGLFSGAVMMSGAGAIPRLFEPLTPEASKDFWDKVMHAAGAADEEQMKTLPAQTLWEAWYKQSREYKGMRHLQPGVDGEIIPDEPRRVLASHGELDIPYIVGITSQDFMPPVVYEMALGWAKARKKAGGKPVYGYFFDHTPPGNSFKAFHACDLWYAFGNMDKSWRPFGGEDRALAAQMMDYIANFAKTGDPNGAGLPQWPAMKDCGMRMKVFDTGAQRFAGPAQCRRRMLHTLLRDKGPM
jgi:carboxylesterase type B